MNKQQQIQSETSERLKRSRDYRLRIANEFRLGRYLQMTDMSKTIQRLNHKGKQAQAARLSQIEQQLSPASGESVKSMVDDPRVKEGNRIVFETLVGTDDMLPIQFLHQGSQRARCVGRIAILPLFRANGTGFMISPRLMMTNHHVIENKEDARRQVVQLDYGDTLDGSLVTFNLRPDQFFETSPVNELDCTIVAVEPESTDGVRLDRFGWVAMGNEDAVQLGERVNLIHHPGGEHKQVSIRDNFVAGEFPDLNPKYWLYASDTRRGSSGAPVFNEEWEVVALHHAAVSINDSEEVDIYRTILQSLGVAGLASNNEAIELNEGIRMPLILEWLRQRAAEFSSAKRDLYEQFKASANATATSLPNPSRRRDDRSIVSVSPVESSAGEGVYSVPMTFNFHLGPKDWSRIEPARDGHRDSDVQRTLELYKNQINSQKSVFTALSYLQTHREGAYLPSGAVLTEQRANYFGDLIEEVEQDQLGADELYDRLHAICSGSLSIVDRFPESMRELDTLVVAERGLESMRILESGAAYSRARAHLYTWVDLQPHRMLRCPYTNAIIAPEQILLNDLIKDLGQGALLPQRFRNNRYLNCEHIVPQSWFKADFPDGVSDLHHLIAADGGANNYRSDCVFRDLDGAGELGPENNPDYIVKAGRRDSGRFEPANGKPVVARATLYFLINYRGALDETKYGAADIDLLKNWAKASAPDEYEQHRNQAAFEAQGNRNPLIDFPEWIDKIDFTRGLA